MHEPFNPAKLSAPCFLFGAFFFVGYLLMEALGPAVILPLVNSLRALVASYGLPIVGLGYLIEGLFLVSFYWPGSFILFLAVAAGSKALGSLAAVWVVVNLAAALAVAINIWIGRRGLHLAIARQLGGGLYQRLSAAARRWGLYSLLLFAFHINWLAMAVVYFASLDKPPLRRIAILSLGAHALSSAVLIAIFAQAELPAAGSDNRVMFYAGLACCFLGTVAWLYGRFRAQASHHA